MATLKVGINRKIIVFLKGFWSKFSDNLKLERSTHLFPKREKKSEREFLVQLLREKRERETRIIKKEFLIILQYM